MLGGPLGIYSSNTNKEELFFLQHTSCKLMVYIVFNCTTCVHVVINANYYDFIFMLNIGQTFPHHEECMYSVQINIFVTGTKLIY